VRQPGWWPVLVAWALLGLALLAAAGLLAVFIVLGGTLWLLLAAGWSLVRQQLAPSRYCRPPLPEPYRVADDLSRPLADVVAAAELDAAVTTRRPPGMLTPAARSWLSGRRARLGTSRRSCQLPR
jgi:hypothetical protein